MKPLISIIIPNYNRGHLLMDVLDSVINQTYQPIEIIVIDDKSTDNSIEIVQKLQESIPNLFLIQQEINSGANACRNLGVAHAKGEYIAFLDSDDYFLPTKLEKQMDIFNLYPEVGFVVTGFGAKTVQVLPEGIIPLEKTILQNNLGGFSTLIVKKHLFDQVGGLDIQLLSCQDWDLFLKLLTICKGYKLAEDLVIYEVQEDSISKNLSKVIQGYK
ncbi:TPA: glycosyltransferase family 2 protein, partial [Streptococcus suis]